MLRHALHHECRGHQEESCFGHGGGHVHPRRAEKPHQRCMMIVFFFCCVVSVVFFLFSRFFQLWQRIKFVCGSRFLTNSYSHFNLLSSFHIYLSLRPGHVQHPAEPQVQGTIRDHLEVRHEQQQCPQRAQQQSPCAHRQRRDRRRQDGGTFVFRFIFLFFVTVQTESA